MKPLVFPKTQHLHVSQVVYVTGGEVGAAISVAPKKIGYDIAWDMKVSVVRLVPYVAALVIKAGAGAPRTLTSFLGSFGFGMIQIYCPYGMLVKNKIVKKIQILEVGDEPTRPCMVLPSFTYLK